MFIEYLLCAKHRGYTAMKRTEKNPCSHRAYDLAGGRGGGGAERRKGQSNPSYIMLESDKYYRQILE